jgi:uncharacterized protein
MQGSLPPHIAALIAPGALPGAPNGAELVQTHGSYVLLTDDRAYKLKKPLDLGFLDYSTLAKRRAACEAEVRLNRRLSSDVYHGLEPVVRTGAGYRLQDSAAGEIVDYAVVMRRVPATEMMDARLAAGTIGAAEIDRLVARLTPFYRDAATGGTIDRAGELETLLAHWQENFLQTLPYLDRTIARDTYQRIAAAVYAELVRLRPVFARRISEGRIRDGHGDLRLSAVCLSDPVQVLDCIEFSDEYRHGDVAADVAFLVMDLEGRGRADLATAFVDRFSAATGDTELRELLPFYCCYRAYVRGKVDSMLLDEAETPAEQQRQAVMSAQRRFEQALAYAEQRGAPSRPPR